MVEIVTMAGVMISLMKDMDLNSTVIITVMFCSLLVLFFNVIALWKLTAPVRKLSDSLDQFASTFTTKMNDGEKRFERNEEDIVELKSKVKQILVKLNML